MAGISEFKLALLQDHDARNVLQVGPDLEQVPNAIINQTSNGVALVKTISMIRCPPLLRKRRFE